MSEKSSWHGCGSTRRAIAHASSAADDAWSTASSLCWGTVSLLPTVSGSWQEQIERAHRLVQLESGWDGDGSLPVSPSAVSLAMNVLGPCMRFVPPPSFSPAPDGSLWALWAGFDLDVEVEFNAGTVFAMISDDAGVIPSYEGHDSGGIRTTRALRELAERGLLFSLKHLSALAGEYAASSIRHSMAQENTTSADDVEILAA